MLNLYEILQQVLVENAFPKDVIDAINNKYRVIINYSDGENSAPNKRLIEPYAYGLSKAGNSVLRAYQYNGDTKRGIPKWKLFRLDRITSWQPTNQHFNISPNQNGWSAEDYNENGDGSMQTVLSQVKFDNGDNLYSPNDRLNKERLKTNRLKNSTPININTMKEPSNQSGPIIEPKNTNINANTSASDIKQPIQQQEPQTNRGPIVNNDINKTDTSNDNNFQQMLKRNLDITQKEKDRRGFSLNKK
jgi:hypothetical protein